MQKRKFGVIITACSAYRAAHHTYLANRTSRTTCLAHNNYYIISIKQHSIKFYKQNNYLNYLNTYTIGILYYIVHIAVWKLEHNEIGNTNTSIG